VPVFSKMKPVFSKMEPVFINALLLYTRFPASTPTFLPRLPTTTQTPTLEIIMTIRWIGILQIVTILE
jgi:hypothetical protein